jgi:hypothetical protein
MRIERVERVRPRMTALALFGRIYRVAQFPVSGRKQPDHRRASKQKLCRSRITLDFSVRVPNSAIENREEQHAEDDDEVRVDSENR